MQAKLLRFRNEANELMGVQLHSRHFDTLIPLSGGDFIYTFVLWPILLTLFSLRSLCLSHFIYLYLDP